jgi:hypothetical protein
MYTIEPVEDTVFTLDLDGTHVPEPGFVVRLDGEYAAGPFLTLAEAEAGQAGHIEFVAYWAAEAAAADEQRASE